MSRHANILYLYQRHLTISLLCLCVLTVIGQEKKFSHLTMDEGLSQSVVNCIAQDASGFIWLGTDDGLNRYDGTGMKVYRHSSSDNSSISGNGILSILRSKDGTMYFGTNGTGLNVYDPVHDNFTHYLHNEKEATSIANNRVRCMYQDARARIWVGTEEGLDLMNDAGTFKHIKLPPAWSVLRVWDILGDGGSGLWLACYGKGLVHYNPDEDIFKAYSDTASDGKLKVEASRLVRTLFMDARGIIWMGTHGAALISFNPKDQSFYYHTVNDIDRPTVVTGIIPYGDDLWLATNYGLSIYNAENQSYECIQYHENDPFGIGNNSLLCLMKDEAGSVWIGTNTGGASIYHETANKFEHYQYNEDAEDSHTLRNNEILAFTEDNDGYIWIGTNGEGLSRFNPNDGTFQHFGREENKTHERILSLFTDTGGRIWFGTWGGGVGCWEPETGNFREPLTYQPGKASIGNNDILDIVADKQDRLWLATLNGISVFDAQADTFRTFTTDDGLSSNRIITLLFDKDGMLWIGTMDAGLMRMDTHNGEIETFVHDEDDPFSISNDWVNCLMQDKQDALWIGTTLGLNRYDATSKRFESFFIEDGLPNDYIYGILQDATGDLWISTNNGICRLKPSKEKDWIHSYGPRDGLQAKEFNQGAYYKASDGTIYFGGINGFNAFNPDGIIDNKHRPKVAISGFKLFGQEIALDTNISMKKSITLSWRDNFFTFRFVALDFVMPGKNKYSYKMDGLDQGWTPYETKNTADYTGLPGGEYTFRVRAMNNDGVRGDQEAVLHLHIIPPFYKTKWFYALCILLTIAGIFVFIRLRTAQINKEKRILEGKVRERTKELAQKNKDITDSINYARRIQEAILPKQETISAHLKEYFIFYKPKDIVSGDFYWFSHYKNLDIIAAVDCTGHGVPGAFMSMIGHNLLNQIVNEKGITDPAQILTELDTGVQNALQQNAEDADTRDGMDIALCAVYPEGELHFCGAYRPLWIMRNGNIEKINGHKLPIGGSKLGDGQYKTTVHKIESGDRVYMFSDGYPDQFGGEKGKKFMTRRLQNIFVETRDLSMDAQASMLSKKLDEWIGHHDQVDDILILGIKF